MTLEEAKLELQLESEERVGFVIRERARMERDMEDAAAGAAAAAITGRGRR